MLNPLFQVTRQMTATAIPEALQEDFSRVIGLAPTLLEELISIVIRPRPPFGAFPSWFWRGRLHR